MKILKLIAATAALALSSQAVIYAKPVEEKNLIKGKDTIAPDRGYIYLHGPQRQSGMFLKIASEEDRQAYEEEWLEALVKAQEKYKKRIKRYEKNLEIAKKTGKRRPRKPIEPTRENFAIDPIELRGSESFGPQFVFSKVKDDDKKLFSYLMEVEPGTYVYYGPILFNPNGGYFGTCFCMGSIQFDVKAGAVTNIGNFLGAAPDYDSVNTGISDIKTSLSASQLTIDELDYTLPETLQAYENVIPDYRASGKVDNHFGVTIDRMPRIAGILDYERDRVVDVKAVVAEKQRAEAEKAAAEKAMAEKAALEAEAEPGEPETNEKATTEAPVQ